MNATALRHWPRVALLVAAITGLGCGRSTAAAERDPEDVAPTARPAVPAKPQTITKAAPGAKATEGGASYFPDLELVNHRGQKLRFYSDLIAPRVVLINVFFARCEAVCPVTMAKMRTIQEWLGDRLGTEVTIVSLTVDPENDTPEVLREYAAKHQVKDGWHLVTGTPEDMRTVLEKLGQFVEDPDTHSNLLIIGNERTGLWKKAALMANVDALQPVVQSVLDDEG